MTVTYGLNFSASSESAALAQFLASKLQAKTALHGSMMFKLTWKVRVTPLGRLIYAHRASALSTSAKGSTSWPTPNAGPQNDTDSQWESRRGKLKAQKMNGNGFGMTLGMATQLTNWPTPRAEERQQANSADNYQALSKEAELSNWPTPHSKASTGAGVQGREGGENLQTSAQLAATSWATPNAPRAHDSENTAGRYYPSKNQKDLDYQAMLSASGATPTGSTAVMVSGGQLNPGLSRWLMGFPLEWDMCAPEKPKSLARSKKKRSAALEGSKATATP